MSDTSKYEYLTYEWRDGRVIVHGWGTYPRHSVLAGQASKTFIDAFDTVEAAKTAYPDATSSHPMLQPQVSLNHLSDGPDWGEFDEDF